jgi:hypothetical protein
MSTECKYCGCTAVYINIKGAAECAGCGAFKDEDVRYTRDFTECYGFSSLDEDVFRRPDAKLQIPSEWELYRLDSETYLRSQATPHTLVLPENIQAEIDKTLQEINKPKRSLLRRLISREP